MYDSVYMYSSALIKSCLKSLHRLGPRFAQPLKEILTEFIDSYSSVQSPTKEIIQINEPADISSLRIR